jgi:phosphoketolase
MDAYWRPANYLSDGQIYLYDNPLLREPLTLAHVKPLLVGHWGTTPGQNFIYLHLNRVIKKYDLTWSEVYPNVTQDEAGLKKLCSSPFRAAFQATSRRPRRGQFMKVENWDIRSAMPSERRSTIRV